MKFPDKGGTEESVANGGTECAKAQGGKALGVCDSGEPVGLEPVPAKRKVVRGEDRKAAWGGSCKASGVIF